MFSFIPHLLVLPEIFKALSRLTFGYLISSSSVPGTCTTSSGAINVPIPDYPPLVATTHTLAVNCVPAGATITGIA